MPKTNKHLARMLILAMSLTAASISAAPLQVFPEGTPSFGERLCDSFSEGFIQAQDQQILQNIKPDATPLEILRAYSQLSPRMQKTIQPLLQELLRGQSAQTQAHDQTQKGSQAILAQKPTKAPKEKPFDWSKYESSEQPAFDFQQAVKNSHPTKAERAQRKKGT